MKKDLQILKFCKLTETFASVPNSQLYAQFVLWSWRVTTAELHGLPLPALRITRQQTGLGGLDQADARCYAAFG